MLPDCGFRNFLAMPATSRNCHFSSLATVREPCFQPVTMSQNSDRDRFRGLSAGPFPFGNFQKPRLANLKLHFAANKLDCLFSRVKAASPSERKKRKTKNKIWIRARTEVRKYSPLYYAIFRLHLVKTKVSGGQQECHKPGLFPFDKNTKPAECITKPFSREFRLVLERRTN